MEQWAVPQSLSDIRIHVIFSTKNRESFIDESIQMEVFSYLTAVVKKAGAFAYQVGGVEDHIHAHIGLGRTVTVSKLIEELKSSSSKWIKTLGSHYKSFAWQRGYGAFSISGSHAEALNLYIVNQQQHHGTVSFEDEYRRILNAYHVSFDERYVWD